MLVKDLRVGMLIQNPNMLPNKYIKIIRINDYFISCDIYENNACILQTVIGYGNSLFINSIPYTGQYVLSCKVTVE